ncbi:MAG: PaaI family thioesterase [Chloroflexi bacterium]|nr:PaaI family thioesterase [Chloroflexota bacterium]MCI0649267.1 PaaI family thioesterase [Chloroflexota bacterium]MCI0728851.1 PaaI family thioesterase [Chloroflexota bacterium]
MNTLDEIRDWIAGQPQPVCAALTPFEVLDADAESGFIKLEFAPQPAFSNHFGNIQGGFAVAMLDVVISCAGFVKLRQWLPTVEIKCSFVAPARIGVCIGEGSVVRAGRSVVFLEGKLWGADGQLAAHATATAMARAV